MDGTQYIATLALDEASIAKRSPELDHERFVAMNDLIEWNHFALKGAEGPYNITLSAAENRIALAITSPTLIKPSIITLTLAPLRNVIRDYVLICESYFEAVKSGNLPKIEAIDMSRRGLHNEGSEIVSELLTDKVVIDYETARRLFTLIHVLHLK